MISVVKTINGVKQLVPLDKTAVTDLDLTTQNNAILKFNRSENRVVDSGFTTGIIPSNASANNKLLVKSDVVDTIAENNMNSVTSNAVAKELKIIPGVITLPDNTMNVVGMLQKQGKRVTMSIRIWKEGEITVNAGQVLAVLPEGFRPKNNVKIYFNINNFDSKNTHQLVIADWYGSIFTVLQQTYNRIDFYLTGSWFTE